MFKTQGNKQSLARQLRNKFSAISSPNKDTNTEKHGENKYGKTLATESDIIIQQSLKEKMTPANNEYINSFSRFFLEHSIAAEFNHLKKTRLPGVYVIPSSSNPLVWFGVIFIRQGFYQGGVFRFTLTIPTNYPDGECPNVHFTPPVYHPCINENSGRLDLEKPFPVWRPNINHIWQILMYLRRIFYKFDSKIPANVQAAQLYESDKEGFAEKVQQSITDINKTLYEEQDIDDLHAIRFSNLSEQTFSSASDAMGKVKVCHEKSGSNLDLNKPCLTGLSFIEPGSSLAFSKEK